MKKRGQSVPSRSSLRLTTAGLYWLLVSAGFASIGIYKGINLILLLAYFLLALMLLNWWLVRRTLENLEIRQDAIDDGFEGESRRCCCHVVLVARKRLRGLQVLYQVADQICRWYVTDLIHGPEVALTRMVVLPRRGIYANGTLSLSNSFPFGLVETTRTIEDDRTFAVFPRRGTIDLARLMLRLGFDTSDRGFHRTAVRQLTEGTDIHGLRPFRPGDSPRWVHWRTTARVGELMVREFDRATGPSLTAVIMPAENEIDFENNLQFAATLIWEWSRRQEGRLKLWIVPDYHWEAWELDHRRRALDFLRRLAAARFSAGHHATLPKELPTRGPIVYISFKPDSSANGGNAEWINPRQSGGVYQPPSLKP